jgi:2'-5' RNA ligase
MPFNLVFDTIGSCEIRRRQDRTHHFTIINNELNEIFRVVQEALPEVPVKRSFQLHMTLAQGAGEQLDEDLTKLAKSLFVVSFTVVSLALLSQEGQEPFEIVHENPLGKPIPPTVSQLPLLAHGAPATLSWLQ